MSNLFKGIADFYEESIKKSDAAVKFLELFLDDANPYSFRGRICRVRLYLVEDENDLPRFTVPSDKTISWLGPYAYIQEYNN